MEKNEVTRNDGSVKIFDDRNVSSDYRSIVPHLKHGQRVLDVGCGTGAITAGIAALVGESGSVVGIDNTAKFIENGQQKFHAVQHMSLICSDLFDYHSEEPFDIIVSARTFQWLQKPFSAAQKLISLLKPGGMLSILDYDHTDLEWQPQPPVSMQKVYDGFLAWRRDAGMDNRIAKNSEGNLPTVGLDKYCRRTQP